MPPRFMQRMQKQSETLMQLYGVPQHDPPPYNYANSRSRSTTTSSLDAATDAPPAYKSATCSETPCIPKGATILVIGASGWLGTHVVDQLITNGYNVRGAVRNDDKALSTAKIVEGLHGSDRYSNVVVPDMTIPGAYNKAVKGCSGVVHVAAVTTFSSDPYEVIPPTIMGALNALASASKEPMVRRFVYCSSLCAASDPAFGLREDISSESWNMSSFKAAWEPPPYTDDRAWSVFSSSKMQAEQAVWKWYRERRPNFVLNCVLPGMLFGKAIAPQIPAPGLPMHILRSISKNNAQAITWTPPQHYADVKDAALLHVAALILPGVMNERLFAASTHYSISELVQSVRERCPSRQIDAWAEHQSSDCTTFLESSRALELLRRMGQEKWTDLGTSISDACEELV